MKDLYKWEKFVLYILMVLSFIAGWQSGGIVDALMATAINTLILFVLFKIGNKIFKKKNVQKAEK